MNHRTSLVPLLCVGALTLPPSAAAQTRIGQVTLTPATPVSGASLFDYAWQPVPAGMNELRGQIATPGPRQLLPAGTQIRVSVISSAAGPARRVASATFTTTRLPTTYQLFYGRDRLISGQAYSVRCVVTDASGRTLFRSADVLLPRLPRAGLDLGVTPASPQP